MLTSFDAHPKEHMATMIHLDGDRLLLTHYCMAKNQPRLIATSFDVKAGEATFEFLDGTGMASRDTGHMDKMLLQLKGDDQYHERWTWFANGAERWLEDNWSTARSTDAISSVGPNPEHTTVGGFFRVRAYDRAEAEAIARACPDVRHGGWIEVREIDRI